MFNKNTLTQRVDGVLKLANEPERQRVAEDDLLRDVIGAFCPMWVKEELHRLVTERMEPAIE